MSVRIIIENGELTIRGTAAEQKAWATVLKNLSDLTDHAGGDLSASADETEAALRAFKGTLDKSCKWAKSEAAPVA